MWALKRTPYSSLVSRILGYHGNILGTCSHSYLMETHLLLTAFGFTATVNFQSHDLSIAANISEDLKEHKPKDVQQLIHSQSLINDNVNCNGMSFPAHLVFEQRLHVSWTHRVRLTAKG